MAQRDADDHSGQQPDWRGPGEGERVVADDREQQQPLRQNPAKNLTGVFSEEAQQKDQVAEEMKAMKKEPKK